MVNEEKIKKRRASGSKLLARGGAQERIALGAKPLDPIQKNTPTLAGVAESSDPAGSPSLLWVGSRGYASKSYSLFVLHPWLIAYCRYRGVYYLFSPHLL